MHLTPREQERLMVFAAAQLARNRLARGATLGATEAIGLVCDDIQENAWDGLPLAEVVERAQHAVPRESLLPGVAATVPDIQVEALFPHGTTLVHVSEPFGPPDADGPGAVRSATEPVQLAPGRPRAQLAVRNTGPRPIWISSHFPLEEANQALEFDRAAATGFRLDVPAGGSLEFTPGVTRTVDIVQRGGRQ